MDFVSHALTGRFVASLGRPQKKSSSWIITAAATIPDLPVAFVYLLLGQSLGRPFWIPFNSDWIGVRDAHPWWSALWEIPHSFLFLLIVIVPLVLYFRLPRLTIAAYASHLVLDLFTHSGEWAVKPLYPLPWTVEGFTDAWAWPFSSMVISWAVLIIMILLAVRMQRKRIMRQNYSR